MVLSPGDTVAAGAVLLAVIAIAYGGTFLSVSMPGSRRPMTCKRRSFEPATPTPACW